ncbi:MAG TPA: hypothetical protein VGT98_04180 [Candidatus Elarobacter sp.]|nr:hypothetical protein [Candidatus Elarobacter sp.]HEV2739337.1 hypothetical protein [Candidatus Elarobacter sp.]
MRLGVFHRLLLEWAEKPCVLTVGIASVGSEVRIAGVLRSYFSLSSLQGWALVPPQQHGGFAAVQLTQLHLEDATQREVLLDGAGHRLRFSGGGETVFELERDDALFTGPPRSIGTGRYLYVGGRRRPAPEAWMLQ